MLRQQGKLEEVLEQYRRALDIQEKRAPDSLDVAHSYNNIESVLAEQDTLEEALEQYGQALKIQEEKAPN